MSALLFANFETLILKNIFAFTGQCQTQSHLGLAKGEQHGRFDKDHGANCSHVLVQEFEANIWETELDGSYYWNNDNWPEENVSFDVNQYDIVSSPILSLKSGYDHKNLYSDDKENLDSVDLKLCHPKLSNDVDYDDSNGRLQQFGINTLPESPTVTSLSICQEYNKVATPMPASWQEDINMDWFTCDNLVLNNNKTEEDKGKNKQSSWHDDVTSKESNVGNDFVDGPCVSQILNGEKQLHCKSRTEKASPVTISIEQNTGKKRGRKKIYEPGSTLEEDISMKRARNNKACGKYRISKKERLHQLFEEERALQEANEFLRSKCSKMENEKKLLSNLLLSLLK